MPAKVKDGLGGILALQEGWKLWASGKTSTGRRRWAAHPQCPIATFGFSRRPLPRSYRPFIRAIFEVRLGSDLTRSPNRPAKPAPCAFLPLHRGREGPESAQSRRPRPWSATSAIRRFETYSNVSNAQIADIHGPRGEQAKSTLCC